MAIDSNGKVYENRTLQFYGYAYGTTPVTLTVTINNTVVFSGEVSTINSPISNEDITSSPVLFTIQDSTLFPSNWEGSYPLSITVTGGDGIRISSMPLCNYKHSGSSVIWIAENCYIQENYLTIGNVILGNVRPGLVHWGENNSNIAMLFGNGGGNNGSVWMINHWATESSITVTGFDPAPGSADKYVECLVCKDNGSAFSKISINGVEQPNDPSATTVVKNNDTLECIFTIDLGDCPQS